jgi:hypothetical protein
MLTYAAAKAAEHEEKGGEEWGGELNTAILRYYQLVLGKTDKRVLVLTLLKAQKERGEKNYWQWQLERGGTYQPSRGKNLPAGSGHATLRSICMGHACRALLLLLHLGGQPAPDLNLHGWLCPGQARERETLADQCG